jgi:hypothetical protein
MIEFRVERVRTGLAARALDDPAAIVPAVHVACSNTRLVDINVAGAEKMTMRHSSGGTWTRCCERAVRLVFRAYYGHK